MPPIVRLEHFGPKANQRGRIRVLIGLDYGLADSYKLPTRTLSSRLGYVALRLVQPILSMDELTDASDNHNHPPACHRPGVLAA